MADVIVKSKHGDVVINVDDWMMIILKDYYLIFNKKTGYVQVRLISSKNKSTTPLQRLVANTPKGYFTHHKNREKNDYRLENLEVIEPEKHSHMQEKHKTYRGIPTSSEFKNVSGPDKNHEWYASIHVGGLHLGLGYYANPCVAAAVSNWFERLFYAENFICDQLEINALESAGVDLKKLIKTAKKNLLKHGKDSYAIKLDNLF